MSRRRQPPSGPSRRPIGLRGWGGALLPWLTCVAALYARPALGDEASLGDAVADLERAAATRVLVTPEQAVARFDDALFTFMVGDYAAAAELAWTVRPYLPEGPLRYEADHLLSVSLESIGARTLAQRVNREILADLAHPFLREAAARQVALYAGHRTAAEFATLYADLRAKGIVDAAADELAYAIGRARWHLGHLDEAERAFELVVDGDAAYDRAQYHLAVIAVARGDLDGAAARFTVLRVAPLVDPAIAELATLSLARLGFERGELDQAAELYRMFGSDSEHSATALEELAWTELRRGDLPAATLALEERLEAFPDAPSPEVQHTLGRLHLQFGAPGPAEAAFGQAVEIYQELLRTIPRLYADPTLPELLGGSERELPLLEAWVVERLRRDDRIVRAASVQEVGRGVDDGLQDAAELQREIEDRLLADPSTVRDRRLLARGTRQLLDIARARLAWAESQLDRAAGRERRPLASTVEQAIATLADVRATLERLDALHRDGARATAEEALRTAGRVAAEVARRTGDPEPAHFEVLGARVSRAVDEIEEQVRSRDGPVHRRLVEEREALRATMVSAQALDERSDALWSRARALGAESLLGEVDESLRGTRSGLADASWERLAELRDEVARLTEDQSRALSELEALFELVARRQR